MTFPPNLFLIKDIEQTGLILAPLEAEPRTAQLRLDSEAYAVQYEDPTEVVIVGRGAFFGLDCGW